MLSEIDARRVAFAFSPATPALSEEDIVMESAFLLLRLTGSVKAASGSLNIALMDKSRTFIGCGAAV
jgi:hypothetical protein